MKKLFWLRLGVLGSVVAALVVSSLLVVSEPSEVEARTTSPYWERASNGTLFYKEGGAIVKQGVPLNSVCPGNAGYSFYNDGCYDTGMFSTGDGDLRFYSNRNSIMKLSSNGRVGIGTTNPQAQLQLQDVYGGGGKNLLIGDDAYLTDLDQANTLGIRGNQDSREASVVLGSGGAKIKGMSNGDLCLGKGC